MALRRLIVVIALVSGSLGRPPLTAAECVRLTGSELLGEKHFEFVFDGTAIEETHVYGDLVRSAVQVHRVWKGTVTQRFVVYGRGYTDESNRALERGTRYVVAAFRHTPKDLPEGGVFTHVCGVVPYQYAGELLRELGRGRAPNVR